MNLFWKFYIASTAMVLITAATLTAANTRRESRHAWADLREEHRLLATLVATQVETGYHEQLWPFEVLHTIAAKPSFTSWQIVDGSGAVVLCDKPGTQQPLYTRSQCDVDRPTLVTDAGEEVTWVVPMRMRTGPVRWTFRLSFSGSSVAANVREIVWINVLWAAAVCVLFIPFSVMLTRLFLRPLRNLTDAARCLGSGDLSAPLPAPSRDELGELITAFGSMSSAIGAARQELERRVEERTAQLATAKMSAEQVAASLRRSNAEMQAIHRTSLDGVLVLDAQRRITTFNPAAERMFKCAAEQAVGEPFTGFVPAMATEEGGSIPAPLGRLNEVEARRPDGSRFPAEIAITAAEMEGPPVYIASVRDLTERKRAEAERDELNRQLLTTSRRAGMAEVATGVLHNVGNVLNSVNVSANVIIDRMQQSNVGNLSKAAAMIDAHRDDLGTFLTADPKGRQLPGYFSKFAAVMTDTQMAVLDELAALTRGIDHIKQVVQMQQSHASGSTLRERVSAASLLDDALRFNSLSLERHQIEVHREIPANLADLELDRHKALQVLVNLISNAKNAMTERTGDRQRRITLSVSRGQRDDGVEVVRIAVADNGVGISRENLTRIFTHGFTTRTGGHGFGLHSCANAAKEMGGALHVDSAGPGLGATFTLELPGNPRAFPTARAAAPSEASGRATP